VNKFVVSLVIILSVCSKLSFADAGDQYLLPKVGTMSVDLKDADTLTSVGLLYGYGITPNFTLESELNLSISGGKYDQRTSNNTTFQGKYTVWTLAGYGVYRYSITDIVFLKGKLGVLYESVENKGTQETAGGASQRDDNTSKGFGIAGGFGVGFQAMSTIIEIELTSIDEDIIFYSLGINYAF